MPNSEHQSAAQLTLEAAITKAGIDLEFRKKLLADPKKALKGLGIDLPESTKVTVHDYSPDDHHIFLPPLRKEPTPDRRGRPAKYAGQQPLIGNTLVRRYISSGFVSNRVIQS
jgi:hypothetical protein